MSEALPSHLAKIMPWLEEAVAETRGTHTVEDVLAGIVAQRLQLWVGERCFAVTEFVGYPQKRTFNIFLAGGQRGAFAREARAIQQGMEAFARAGGATLFTNSAKVTEKVAARIPWSRIGSGFQPSWIVMTKELAP